MKIVVTRFIVAGLIAASIVFLAFYFLRAPQPAISTYYQVSNLLTQNEYKTFDEQLTIMNSQYLLGSAINANFTQVEQALDNNFNYYNTYLLFVKNVSETEQILMNQKIKSYKNALEETYTLLTHFNQNYSLNESINAGMHQNFVNAYKTQISRYLELTETLKNYVIRYAFNNITPVGLKQTLLQVQLDYAKVIMNSNYAYTHLLTELNDIKTKYANFSNEPQSTRLRAIAFIDAYANFENLQEYIESSTKQAYVDAYPEGVQGTYVYYIHKVLTHSTFNNDNWEGV